VVASVVFNKTGVLITNTDSFPCQGGLSEVLMKRCTFIDTGSFLFFYETSTGMTGSLLAQVDRIDRELPQIDHLVYSPSSATSQPVLAVVTLNESGTMLTSGWIASGARSFLKYYTANATEEIFFSDLAGNVNSGVLKVDWIIPPSGGGT
jgi:hypothetical protein